MTEASHYQRKIRGPWAFYWNKIEASIKSFFYNSNWQASKALGQVKPEWETVLRRSVVARKTILLKGFLTLGKFPMVGLQCTMEFKSRHWVTMEKVY